MSRNLAYTELWSSDATSFSLPTVRQCDYPQDQDLKAKTKGTAWTLKYSGVFRQVKVCLSNSVSCFSKYKVKKKDRTRCSSARETWLSMFKA